LIDGAVSEPRWLHIGECNHQCQAKCKRVKWLRGSSFADSLDPMTSQRDQFNQTGDFEEQSTKHSIQHLSECGRETPVSRASASAKSHYYADDSEMPAWKIYAKDLFLYGGSGLWRSASLKGSDPVLLTQDESINRSRSQLRSGSLSGSVMGALGNNSRWNKRKLSEVGSNSSHSRLRAANIQPAAFNHQPMLVGPGTAARSVSFREGSMSNYWRSKRMMTRTRPGSLRTGSALGPASEPPLGRRYSLSPRLPGRQASIRESRESRESQSPGDVVPESLPHPTATDPSRMAVLSADKLGRSASMSEPNRSGWRSSLVKLMRAKSTSGNSVMASASPSRTQAAATAAAADDWKISICVIQPTPAASPCASIRALGDRRKHFAGTKGQTIDAEMDILPYGSLMVPPSVDYTAIIDPRCRSTSPRLQTSFGSGCRNSSGELVAQIHQSIALNQPTFISGTGSQ